MIVIIVIAVLIIAIGVFVVGSYNRFVSQSKAMQSLWVEVEAELRRRHELLPNLAATVEGHAAHERGVLEEVARTCAAAQAAHGAAASSVTEGPLAAAVGRLIAVAESYPELKASQNFRLLQLTLMITEDGIRQARSLYNAHVEQFNRRVQMFPSNLIAGGFHFHRADYFNIEYARRDEVTRADS